LSFPFARLDLLTLDASFPVGILGFYHPTRRLRVTLA
jgi:hypothetical protein